MEKLQFDTIGQFLEQLSKGSLYNEETREARMSDEGDCVLFDSVDTTYGLPICYSTLEGIKRNLLSHTYTKKPIPKDKDLVFYWDGLMVGKQVGFYDSIHNSVFTRDGGRSMNLTYPRYEVIRKNPKTNQWDPPFDWANESVKKLDK